MHLISRDDPALYLTCVAKDRLQAFRTETIKSITCEALDEARKSGGFAIYAYVIMPDHIHAITDSPIKPSKTLQYINGIISHRVIDYLKEHGHNSSLRKLQRESGARGHRFTVGTSQQCATGLQRRFVHAKGELHSSESSESWISGPR